MGICSLHTLVIIMSNGFWVSVVPKRSVVCSGKVKIFFYGESNNFEREHKQVVSFFFSKS